MNILNHIKDNINNDILTDINDNIEIELRLGEFINKSFIPGIIRSYYFEILNLWKKIYNDNWKYEETMVYNNNNERYVYINNKYQYTITKTKLGIIDLPQFNIRLSKSLEIKTILNKYCFNNPRHKKRTTFILKDIPFKIEFTEVDFNNIRSYEIEIELIDNTISSDKFIEYINQIYNTLYHPFIIISSNEKNYIINQYNKLNNIYITKYTNFNLLVLYRYINKPINFKIKHMYDIIKSNTYTVTNKLDGERKLLYIYNDSLYFIYNDDVRKIYHNKSLNIYNDTVLDGEYYINNDNKEFHIFDIQFFNTKNIGLLKNHLERLDIANKIIKYINNIFNDIIIKIKTFYTIQNIDDFYLYVNKIYDTNLYKNDGLIFTPILDIYDNKYTYKYKEPKDLTIDFKIKYISDSIDNVELYYFNLNTKLNEKLINYNGYTSKKYKNDDIIEFKYCNDNKRFESIKIRSDKLFPNSYPVVMDILTDIQNPIDINTIKGKNLYFMRKYHNQVKKDLLTDIPNKSIIADIGSGKGGEILKYKEKNFLVYAIEPNQIYINEFNERMDTLNYYNIIIINSPGEDYDKIINEINKLNKDIQKADVVVMYFSLTFFFKSKELLLQLYNTINNMLSTSGLFIGTVFDGTKVNELFDKQNTTEIKYDFGKLIKNYKTYDTLYNNTINVHFNDTIVTNQNEYLVDIQGIIDNFDDFTLIDTSILDNFNNGIGKLLSKENRELSKLYISFIFKKDIKLLTSELYTYDSLSTMFTIFGFKFVRIEMPLDGSCFYHALLYLINNKYQLSKDKIQFNKNIRKLLSKKFSKKIYNNLGKGELAKSKITTYIKLKQDLLICTKWANFDQIIEYISDIFNVNVFIIKNNGIPYPIDINIYKSSRTSILILNHDNIHFEGLARINDTNIQSSFNHNDKIVQTLLNF